MATTIRVWPVPRVPARKPDILKDSSAKSQSLCMCCRFVGHTWTSTCKYCGHNLLHLNNKVKAPKKGDLRGWRQLLVAYAWMIHNQLGNMYPCKELNEYESHMALHKSGSHRQTQMYYNGRYAILERWVLELDDWYNKKVRNKSA